LPSIPPEQLVQNFEMANGLLGRVAAVTDPPTVV
jgi:hypothetical protein